MKHLKVIIAGGRDFEDYSLLKQVCDKALRKFKKTHTIEIVSGTARGADKLGEQYAKEKDYKLTQFPADWNTFPKAGGIIRNGEMARYAQRAIIFWNGRSKGTESMIKLARHYKLKRIITPY